MSDVKEIKIDLHSHSTLSKDGGISITQYEKLLETGRIDYIAVTDHNEVKQALAIQERLGMQIIVGEEVMTTHGEVIGLFLTERVPDHMSMPETIAAIKAQNGITYLPHPYDGRRNGKLLQVIDQIIHDIDIVEIFNPRTTSLTANRYAVTLAKTFDKPAAASSDSHSAQEVGRTFSIISAEPTAENLPLLLKNADYRKHQAYPWHYMNPLINIIKKKSGFTSYR